MPKIITIITESVIFFVSLWVLSFLSTFLHELGHALGYMFATGDRHWHIRVGWGKRLVNTKALTVSLLVFDGFFTPSGKKIDTKFKLISTLSGGPIVSLLVVLGLLALKCRGVSIQSGIFADGVIESYFNIALFLNLFILVLSLIPAHYFFGEIKGSETDGLQMIHALKKHGD